MDQCSYAKFLILKRVIMKLNRESSIIKIPPSALMKICSFLDVDGKYKDLAMQVTKRNGDHMFNTDDIKLVFFGTLW